MLYVASMLDVGSIGILQCYSKMFASVQFWNNLKIFENRTSSYIDEVRSILEKSLEVFQKCTNVRPNCPGPRTPGTGSSLA